MEISLIALVYCHYIGHKEARPSLPFLQLSFTSKIPTNDNASHPYSWRLGVNTFVYDREGSWIWISPEQRVSLSLLTRVHCNVAIKLLQGLESSEIPNISRRNKFLFNSQTDCYSTFSSFQVSRLKI